MAFITRDGQRLKLSGSDWRAAGVNMYWHSLDQGMWGADPNTPGALNVAYPPQSRIDDGFNTAVAIGCNFARIHVCPFAVGSPKSLWPDGVNLNETAAVQTDLVISRAAAAGLRLMIPLCDPHGYFFGSVGTWSTTNGGDGTDFFTNATVINAFKARLTTWMGRESTITGLTPAEDDTIFCFELGNEINPTDAWVTNLAAHLKSIAPNTLVSDGRHLLAVSANSLSDGNVDIVGKHAYPLDDGEIGTYSATVGGGKVVIWGEYDMHRVQGGDTLANWIAAAEADWPDTWATCAWQMSGHREGFGVADYDNFDGKNTFSPGYSSLPYLTHSRTAWIAVRNHSYAMRGMAVPAASTCPAPVAAATGNQRLKWQGSAGADTYTIQSYDAGWSNETTGKKDSETPLSVSGAKFRRVIPVNIDGSNGTPSDAVYTGGDLTGLIEQDLIAYWPMTESEGNAYDAAGGHDLTERSGAIGTSLGMRDFESGDTEHFLIVDTAELRFGDIARTIQCKVRLESKAAHLFFVSKWVQPDLEFSLWYNQTSDRFRFEVSSDGTAGTIVTVNADNLGSPSTGVTYLIHAWHDPVANVIAIAVNAGTASTTSHSAGVYSSANANLSVGANIDGGSIAQPYDGLMGHVAIWNRVLTSDERTALNAAGGVITFEEWPEFVAGHPLGLLGVGA